MADKVLIIGNGFDLYHRLPTRYTDFLKFAEEWEVFYKLYMNNKEKESENIRLGDKYDVTKETIKDWSTYSQKLDEKRIEYLNDNITVNKWILWFLKQDTIKDGWIDFEKEIERVLSLLDEFYENSIYAYFKDGEVDNKNDLELIFNIFGEKVDFPFIQVFDTEIIDKVPEDYKKPREVRKAKLKLIDELKEELNNLQECLLIYLQEFVSIIEPTVFSEQIKEIGKLCLLNFNYTYSFHNIYKEDGGQLIEHHPIHGELRDESVVLGVGDEILKDNKKDFIYFRKFFQRIQKRKGVYYSKWINELQYISEVPTEVYVAGHSLDIIDKSILSFFFKNDQISKITIFYHNQRDLEQKIINIIECYDEKYLNGMMLSDKIIFEKWQEPVGI